jgi:4-hydroxythreonine-4-phosphate dehydrogenase
MAIKLLKKGDYSHLITAPLSKKGVSYHIPDFIGHTEYLAQAFNTKDFSMMLANETFRVVLVTTHVSIRELPDLITKESVVRAVYNADNFLKSVGDERGIGVCALNPHAGEDGLLGDEEIKVIIPAVRKAIEDGIKVSGPYPADSLFKSVYNNPYGVYVAMYHDQGLGPLKMVSKGRGVNITLGLPVFRISVDHGTAYDIAGKGIASEESLVEAIEIAKKVII